MALAVAQTISWAILSIPVCVYIGSSQVSSAQQVSLSHTPSQSPAHQFTSSPAHRLTGSPSPYERAISRSLQLIYTTVISGFCCATLLRYHYFFAAQLRSRKAQRGRRGERHSRIHERVRQARLAAGRKRMLTSCATQSSDRLDRPV